MSLPNRDSPNQRLSNISSDLDLSDFDLSNQRELRKLVVSVRATKQRFGLLLAICDSQFFQDRLIAAYEAELRAEGITPLQVELDTERPSLRAALENLVAKTPDLQRHSAAVVTILNASMLMSVQRSKQKEEKSEQERFFFSLQWTREALRKFEFPIVLWLSDRMATRLAQQAPDFWSWRSGVFEFEDRTPPSIVPAEQQPSPRISATANERENAAALSIEELQQQIESINASSSGSPLLITLYNALGDSYERIADYSSALKAFENALTVATKHEEGYGKAIALENKGNVLATLSQYPEARAAYDAAIENWAIAVSSNPDNLQALIDKGNALQGLADLQATLSQYQQAQQTYVESIAAYDGALSLTPDGVNALNNKGNALSKLANLQAMLSQHQQAQQTYVESIAAYDGALSIAPDYEYALNNKGSSLQSLADLQAALSQHQQAQQTYVESIAAYDGALSLTPDYVNALNNKGNALLKLANLQAMLSQHQQAQQTYVESIAAYDEALSIAPDYVYALSNKGFALLKFGQLQARQGQETEAANGFSIALNLCERSLAIAPNDTQIRQLYSQLTALLNQSE